MESVKRRDKRGEPVAGRPVAGCRNGIERDLLNLNKNMPDGKIYLRKYICSLTVGTFSQGRNAESGSVWRKIRYN